MTGTERLDATFAALADPTRRAILARLAAGEATVTDLARPFAISQPAVSKHLKVLERAGPVARRRALGEASGWLEAYRRFWESSDRRRDALLEELQSTPPAAPGDDAPGGEPPQE